ncbi:unnamed protein product [Rhizoctonia solani]|uniref:BTB domain-containing protein n=1 Tax=Rhizoctonia solani TaxID=456999 RepID=A0A8H3BDI2_9AGAM|nr:unnamed protein product [Rhizoctonia solani]
MLLKSETFSDMFKLPRGTAPDPEEGTTPESPISLNGVTASDFEALLRVLYASHFSADQLKPSSTIIIPAFRLANMWHFEELRAHLMPIAEKMFSDVDKLVFAREFQLEEWIVPAHIKLCQRSDPLNSEEASKIGLPSLLFVSRIREEILKSKSRKMLDSTIQAKANAWIKDGCVQVPMARHPEFYFEGTLVFIQIQDTLFNVHKSQLLKSKAFSKWFEVQESVQSEERGEGLSPDKPIFMENIEISDFEALLKALYTPQFSDSRPSLNASFIISAFRMANLWQFSELRAFLLNLADQILGDVDKISFAKEFGLKEWLLTPHVNLCQRDQQLDLEEAKKIGIDSLLIINNLREEFSPQKLASYRTLASGCTGIAQGNLGYTYPGNRHPAARFSYLGTGVSYESMEHCSACLTKDYLPTAEEVNSTIQARIRDWIEGSM